MTATPGTRPAYTCRRTHRDDTHAVARGVWSGHTHTPTRTEMIHNPKPKLPSLLLWQSYVYMRPEHESHTRPELESHAYRSVESNESQSHAGEEGNAGASAGPPGLGTSA